MGRPEQGSAGIAAYADGDVRFESVNDLAGLADGRKHFERDLDVIDQVLQVELSLQAHDGQPDNLVTGRRDLFHLHLAFRTDEKDLTLGVEFLEFVRDRDGREDMSPGASAADDDP